MDEKDFPQNLEDCHKLIKQLLEVTQSLFVRIEKLEEENKALKERLNNNSSKLWTFIFVDGVEPTNNHAERCLRPAVIWRKKSFGTRSDYGSEFVARTMSFITTCKLQTKNSFELLKETMQCFFSNTETPSLI